MEIKTADYIAWVRSWNSEQRLGQHFLNTLLPNVNWPELFYADNYDASKMIVEAFDSGKLVLVDDPDMVIDGCDHYGSVN